MQNNLSSSFFGSRVACAKPRSFPPNCALKMRERHQFFFGLRLVSKEFHYPTIQTKIEQHFGGFFHQIKVIGRQDSMQTVIWTSRRLDSFLHEALRTFQIFKREIKKSKTYSGWCPFQGLSNGSTFMYDPSWPDGILKGILLWDLWRWMLFIRVFLVTSEACSKVTVLIVKTIRKTLLFNKAFCLKNKRLTQGETWELWPHRLCRLDWTWLCWWGWWPARPCRWSTPCPPPR